MSEWMDWAQELFPINRAIRRDLHQHPELGFQEIRTAALIARQLRELGLEVVTGIAKTGVVGTLKGAKPGPTILARFDMDALPIQEEAGAVYASINPGVMHACGHDGHVAIGLTTARMLASRKQELAGQIRFVFQPAEEGQGGAFQMVAQGAADGCDFALALHLWNDRPAGWVGLRPGPVMAGADVFKVRIQGVGGHGAVPHQTVDPIVAGAQMITALQTIVSRNVSALKTGVISVGAFHAGEALNVIPATAEFGGTIRFFEPAVQARMGERIRSVCQGTAQAMGCTVDVEIEEWTRAVVNDESVTGRLEAMFGQEFPELSVDADCQTMASEDASAFLERVPGVYFFVGSANKERGLSFSHHHPRFDFDEQALTYGAGLMAAGIWELSQKAN